MNQSISGHGNSFIDNRAKRGEEPKNAVKTQGEDHYKDLSRQATSPKP